MGPGKDGGRGSHTSCVGVEVGVGVLGRPSSSMAYTGRTQKSEKNHGH